MNYKLHHTLIALVTLAAGISTPVGAAIIFDNGAADGARGYWSDFSQSSGQQMADNFVLGADGNTITGINWSGSYYSSNIATAVDDFTLRIFTDSGGDTPGVNPLFEFNVGNAVNRLDSGINDSTFGLDIYNYSATVASTTLAVGQTYWLSVVANTAGESVDWLWETTATSDGEAYRNNDGNSWNQHDRDMAFALTSVEVPEPPAMLLFGAGLLGLVATRRKIRVS